MQSENRNCCLLSQSIYLKGESAHTHDSVNILQNDKLKIKFEVFEFIRLLKKTVNAVCAIRYTEITLTTGHKYHSIQSGKLHKTIKIQSI